MQNDKINLLQDVYSAYLEAINGIKFTRREIDIIACLLSGRTSKTIARFLLIEEKTVETHKYNIMRKLECNSRESIREFIEKSDKFSEIKKHYVSLLIQAAFKHQLGEVSVRVGKESPVCLIVYSQEQENKAPLIHKLETHLKLAGLKIQIEERENHKSVTQLIHNLESQQIDSIIYSVSEALIAQLQACDSKAKLEIAQLTQRAAQKQGSVIFLLEDREATTEIPQELSDIGYVDFGVQENYYFSVFEILKKISLNVDLDKVIAEFKSQYQMIYGSVEKSPPQIWSELSEFLQKEQINSFASFWQKGRNWLLIGFVLSLSAIGILAFTINSNKIGKAPRVNKIQENKSQKPYSVRSDLPIPVETALLQRPQLMTQIEDKLKGQQGIQTVALVGIGGAGKTTIARQYAHAQKSSIVWEINAETTGSLISSCEKLAYALSKTEEEKKILRELHDIKNTQEREDKIILLVKEKLKYHSNWLLIYDNVEKFMDLQKYFPFDPDVWGRGKVIITTRDSNIKNNSHINNSLQIGELDPKEKLNLFIKIMSNRETRQPAIMQKEQAVKFLEHIPPFPLDVSIAAYYVRATNIPYIRYLEHLRDNNENFALVQENVLKGASDYTKTRYSIITLTLKQLIDTHEDFMDLLLFISLLDSQNIPGELLDAYKNKIIVDNFIYNLKKYSFITSELLTSCDSMPSFSIHHSIQQISLAYLTKKLSLEKDHQFVQTITDTLENYMAYIIDREDFPRMKLLAHHCEIFLKHNKLLSDVMSAAITAGLGCIYYYQNYSMKAKQLLNESIMNLNKNYGGNECRIARALVYLGNAYRELDQFDKAKSLLEQSLEIYNKHSKNHVGMARAAGYLGIVYRGLGNFEKAKRLLEQSLVIYNKHSENYIGTAWALAHLGWVYRALGNFEKAKDSFEQSLILYKEYSKDHVGAAWVAGDLGNVYIELGNYEKAKNLLEESLLICRGNFPETHVYVANALTHLGIFYKKLGNYKKAKDLFEQSLITYEKNYGKEYILNAPALRNLGQVYLLEGYMEIAENLINKSLEICQQYNYYGSYMSLESLAELYMKKSMNAANKGEMQQSQNFKKQAINYLKQALEIAQTHFPENSPHIIRIQAAIKTLAL